LVDDLEDVIGGESFRPQALFELGQKFCVYIVAGIEDGHESVVFIAEAVEEVLSVSER
jgi:hypothetical protein